MLAPLALALALGPPDARADTLAVELVDRGTVRLVTDGRLSDWRRFTELIALEGRAQIATGADRWSGEADATVGFALARDDQFLYIAAEVHDDQVVRSREHRAGEDTLVVSLGVTGRNGRASGFDVTLQPGVPGSFAGRLTVGGRPVRGAAVVEENLSDIGGFTIEAQIPWSALPGVRESVASLRGRVAYQDADTPGRPGIETVLSTGPGDAAHVEQMAMARGSTVGTAGDLIAQFRQAQNLATAEPLFDRSANLAGDAQRERVVLFPGVGVVAGPGIQGGARYAFFEHPARTIEDLLDASVRDVTGDGRLDVVLRMRVGGNGMTREVLWVFAAPGSAQQIERVFAHELSRSASGMRVHSRASFEAGPRIRVTFAGNEGFTERNFPRVVEPGVLLPMLPWGEHRSVGYQWSESTRRFESVATEPNPARVAAATGPVTAGRVGADAGASAVPTADLAAVLRAARQRAGVGPEARPDFAAEGNVAEDRQPEVVHVYGRTVVVAGRGFMSGRTYYSVELPEGFTVRSLELADVTDDGVSEAVLRASRPSRVQVRGESLELTKDFLLVYSLDAAHRGRIFAAEIARRLGMQSVVNDLRPLARGRSGALTIAPGRASGWTADSYPFRDAPTQGFAPILLPWASTAPVTYRWNGQALAAP